ncbi:MAG: four helix bundle protein [Pseudomonadota bacterium]
MNEKFRSYQLALELYRECSKLTLPSHLKDQLLRASSSVALNLSEGNARRTEKEKRQFFHIAFGSLRETQTILDIGQVSTIVVGLADKTAANVYRLLQSFHGL